MMPFVPYLKKSGLDLCRQFASEGTVKNYSQH